jgi:hypothetical protein
MRPLRQLFEPSYHMSALDLLCFTKSWGEPARLAENAECESPTLLS